MTEQTNQVNFATSRPGLMPRTAEMILQDRLQRKMTKLDPSNKSLDAVRYAVKIRNEYDQAMSLLNRPPLDRRPKKQTITNQTTLL